MANIHNPERYEGESFAAYKARRAQSKATAKSTRLFWDSTEQGTYSAQRQLAKGRLRAIREARVAVWRAEKRSSVVA